MTEQASTLEQARAQDLDRRAKSELLAQHLTLLHQVLWTHDPAFIREAGNDMCNDANRMDSAAALIRNYTPTKSELLMTQGKAMLLLAEYMDTVNKCGELKARVHSDDQQQALISKMFGL